MLSKLKRGIRKVRHKLARVALGLTAAEQRIKHHRHRREVYRRKGSQAGIDRATKYLHRWQERQTWLAGKHTFLQVVLKRRLRKKRKWLEEHPEPAVPPTGLVTLDGKQVAAWIADILLRARASGLWHGYVISGWRSKRYSRELCENMCGAPSCPGRCAGEATNHVGIDFPEGAVDLSDSAGFEAALRALGESRLRNDLPLDDPHYSNSGH